MAEKFNRRLNLLIPRSLLERLNQEILFLGIGYATVVVESQEVENRNELIRLLVRQYWERFQQGVAIAYDFSEETDYLPFYLGKQVQGHWQTAIKDGAAGEYKDLTPATCSYLVANAIYDYFLRQEQVTESVYEEKARLDALLKNRDWKAIREFA